VDSGGLLRRSEGGVPVRVVNGVRRGRRLVVAVVAGARGGRRGRGRRSVPRGGGCDAGDGLIEDETSAEPEEARQ
jgi:hypothetical protein